MIRAANPIRLVLVASQQEIEGLPLRTRLGILGGCIVTGFHFLLAISVGQAPSFVPCHALLSLHSGSTSLPTAIISGPSRQAGKGGEEGTVSLLEPTLACSIYRDVKTIQAFNCDS